jgi:hypothetical protein
VLPLLSLTRTFRIFLVLASLSAIALRIHGPWWRNRWVRRGLLASLAVVAVAFFAWSSGAYPFAAWGVVVSWSVMIALPAFVVALWLTAIVRLSVKGTTLLWGRLRARPKAVETPSKQAVLTRRALFEGGLAALPVASFGATAHARIAANAPARLPIIPLRFADLPPQLEGLRILQISDAHLGPCVRSADLEACLQRAKAVGFDLIVATGDLADDLGELKAGLEIIHRYRGRLGALASLGNHEYLHDIEATRAIYEASPVRLLVDEGVAIDVDGAKLYVGGADDPHGGTELGVSVARAAKDAPKDAFRLLLSHRPEGYYAGAEHGFHLTLSGHTHGGQIGWLGRSAFHWVWKHALLWGLYGNKAHKLYTTSGFGHWFPFRLGCPTEAPILELRRG